MNPHSSSVSITCTVIVANSAFLCCWTLIILTSVPVISLLAFLHPSVSFIAYLYVCIQCYPPLGEAGQAGGWSCALPRRRWPGLARGGGGMAGRKPDIHSPVGGWAGRVTVLEPDHLNSVDVMQILYLECSLEPPPIRTVNALPYTLLPLQPFHIHFLYCLRFLYTLQTLPRRFIKVLVIYVCKRFITGGLLCWS